MELAKIYRYMANMYKKKKIFVFSTCVIFRLRIIGAPTKLCVDKKNPGTKYIPLNIYAEKYSFKIFQNSQSGVIAVEIGAICGLIRINKINKYGRLKWANMYFEIKKYLFDLDQIYRKY